MRARIFIPATERPSLAELPVSWKLFDGRSELRREDRGTLDSIPRAKDVEMVLPAERVLFARLKLPKVNAATIRELLPFAVEDRLLADPSHIHAVAGGRNARGETVVAVVDREWLQARVDALAAAGLRPTSAYCESALLAGGRGDWHVVWGRARGMLVDDEGVAASFDRGTDLPLALRVALDEAAARGDRPASVRVHVEDGEPLPDLARWSSDTGVAFAAGSEWEKLARGQPAAGTIDLLQGDLAPRRPRIAARAMAPAAILACLIVAAQALFVGVDAMRKARERTQLEAQRDAIFRGAFPEARAVVDPELQMARNLEELRRARGLAAGDDFLAQLTRVARESKSVRSVEYESGRLVAK